MVEMLTDREGVLVLIHSLVKACYQDFTERTSCLIQAQHNIHLELSCWCLSKIVKGLEVHVQLGDRAFRLLLSMLRLSESRSTH